VSHFLAKVECLLLAFFATDENGIVGSWLTASESIVIIGGWKHSVTAAPEHFGTKFSEECITTD